MEMLNKSRGITKSKPYKIRRVIPLFFTFFLLINCHNNYSQTKEKFCDKHCWISTGTVITGFTLDHISSNNKYERNPIVKNDKGIYDHKKAIMYQSLWTGVTFVGQRKYPKAMSITRYIISGIYIGISIKNFNKKQPIVIPQETIWGCQSFGNCSLPAR